MADTMRTIGALSTVGISFVLAIAIGAGFGWFLDAYRGRARMWHTGSTRGFRTAIERFPAEKLTVIVLCNRTDLDAAALALQAADLFLK